MMKTKVCVACGQEFPLDADHFYRHTGTKHGFRNKCKPCWAEHNRDDPVRARERHLVKTYGLSLDDFEAKLVSQGGGCAICGGLNPHGKSLCVDHNHTTGEVRGLLCDPCNKAIGLLREDKRLMRKAIAYLDLY